ncbi:hypothetical protein [Halapricum salinum]|uniref:Uncharacterized protein n=1 Tax=Halapricum salinum TaxID=1457250 RepID=A0A4D6H9F3_9EURY|nr:hypothetical protein [Halapricum salinum]QCC50694.1 hypothetical protein DV733_05290 [Halapricum salinum]
MTTTLQSDETEAQPPAYGTAGTARIDRWLAAGLVVLAGALALNTLLGPLFADAIAYPFSETMVNQTLGLEVVTLFVVAPWALVAATLLSRGHRAAPFLAIPPAAYAAYMFVQYVLGPTYLTYQPAVVFHLGIFVCSWLVLAVAWRRTADVSLPACTARCARRTAIGLVALAAFTTFQYVPTFAGFLDASPLSAEAAADPTMFWSIVFLDLGVVVPATILVAWGLLREAGWARRAAYGVAGWFVLVPISVATMGLVMLANDDPNAAVAQVVVLSVAALAFSAFAVWVFRPLFGGDSQPATESDAQGAE